MKRERFHSMPARKASPHAFHNPDDIRVHHRNVIDEQVLVCETCGRSEDIPHEDAAKGIFPHCPDPAERCAGVADVMTLMYYDQLLERRARGEIPVVERPSSGDAPVVSPSWNRNVIGGVQIGPHGDKPSLVPPMDPERESRARASFGSPDFAPIRFACPLCSAKAGQRCKNGGAGGRGPDGRSSGGRAPHHHERTAFARKICEDRDRAASARRVRA